MQIRNHAIMAEQVAHQTAKRSGDDGRNWTPQRLGRCVQHDHDADDREGGKRDGVEHFAQNRAAASIAAEPPRVMTSVRLNAIMEKLLVLDAMT